MKFFSIDFHRIRHMDGTTKHLYPIASQKSSNCLCKDKQERAESIPELLGMNIRKNYVSLPRGTNGSFHHFSHIASIRLAMLVCLAYHTLPMRRSHIGFRMVCRRHALYNFARTWSGRERMGIPAHISSILMIVPTKGISGISFF